MTKGKNILTALCLMSGISMMGCVEEGRSPSQLQSSLEKLLQEKPEIVMEVLRKNSVNVLDIVQEGSKLKQQQEMRTAWREDLKTNKEMRLLGRPVLGSPDAKVHIVAYSDFTCHFCKQSTKTIDAIRKEFGDKVNFTFKALPLNENGPGVIAAAYFYGAAQQSEETAWKMYDMIFANSEKLLKDGENYLKELAKELKLDMEKLDNDVHSKQTGDLINEDVQDAQRLGINGTPHFFVNNVVVRGALPPDMFREAVNLALDNVK